MTREHMAAIYASAVGLVAHLIFVASVLCAHHGDASWFVRFGVEARQTVLARQLFGNVATHPDVGADGQFFWIIARDPLLRASTTATWLDRPVYRTQRIAYPALAAPWRVFGERGVLWGLLLENLVTVAVGSYLTGCLAISLGLPGRTALAFAFNPGVMFATMFDLCDALALAATIGALYAAITRKPYALTLFAAVAGLAKEPAALALGAAAVASGFKSGSAEDGRPSLDRATRVLLIAPALVGIFAWGAYARSRFGWAPTGIVEFGAPFVGLARSWRARWAVEGLVLEPTIAALLVIGALVIVILCVKRRTLLLFAALPYALLVPFFSEHVMFFTNNALRAFAPAFTFLWLEVYRVVTVRANAVFADHSPSRPLADWGPPPTER